jgi:sec-independent protein translocase protein TatA
MSSFLAFIPHLGPMEIMLLLVLGVLLFGRKLPEVGRSLGKGIVEFKKGLKGVEDDFSDTAAPAEPRAAFEPPRPPQRVQATTPKFEDTPAGPVKAPPQA